ncbi:hypothetical protein RND71_001835 [Anisodus tanguticus]|uniref:Large ribosomal subunit protein uL16m n=1 Tax=Anisodus tanguticus TaxID=243964 RepID=A0AAE1VRE6_9SOLA|nr:hypothetical protein RND71_001835 [Anisodus tanguticus]
MGRGKGSSIGWIAGVSRGQILFEMDGVGLSNAQQAATLAAHKLCSSTKFVQWSPNGRPGNLSEWGIPIGDNYGSSYGTTEPGEELKSI